MNIGNIDGFMNRLISMSNDAKNVQKNKDIEHKKNVTINIQDLVTISDTAKSKNIRQDIEKTRNTLGY